MYLTLGSLSSFAQFNCENESMSFQKINWIDHYYENGISSDWDQVFNDWSENDPHFMCQIEDYNKINRWIEVQLNPDDYPNVINHATLKRYSCEGGDGKLYPAYPSQEAKIYHKYYFGTYRNQLLTNESVQCRFWTNNQLRICQDSFPTKFIVASDLFYDSCGNLYRAFWRHFFLGNHESIADLFSRGRTQRITAGEAPDPLKGGDNYYEVVTSYTYGVSVDDFFLLSEPLDSSARNSGWSDQDYVDRYTPWAEEQDHLERNGLLWRDLAY